MFDSEITLLTVRHTAGTTFCDPVGHVQVDGDYRESWQPAALPRRRARRGTAGGRDRDRGARRLGRLRCRAVRGRRPGALLRGVAAAARHRPGHVGVPGPVRVRAARAGGARAACREILRLGTGVGQEAAASCAVLAEGTGVPRFTGVDAALAVPTAQVRLFGKPQVAGRRRVAVTLARGADVAQARERARTAAAALHVELD